MNVTPDLLILAYRDGVFPMAESRNDPEIFWVDPQRRGIFPLEGFHISRSLARQLRRDTFSVTLNQAFQEVVHGCADRDETWISNEIFALYSALHRRGEAHSLEIWQDRELVGGVYGVTLGSAFCGESMFSRRTNASKVALAWLICHLRTTGFMLFDTQFLTPHLASLGAVEISRSNYQRRLADALDAQANILSVPLPASGQEVLQRSTQTS
ncbi:leucyl/phenylalanyl-tRNA--protein transferase [Puniceibacterium sp. IMCC21224]|uniref:leucyl/phenylalanyl-tRNA--protein transferase n=1 Tax=Puniceibacterium sp. IMCC21224 TaxID=1618204 RepID=UPI00064E0D98|nr:leucyl/phenylalanyl-tRNA--protein transferase [Puniceibacterium sp. IMCC21224]KMK66502.1 leucyl/phenylalanyl-tRNA--protein transferase [Puniceibacterium sp. IMCC21224]